MKADKVIANIGVTFMAVVVGLAVGQAVFSAAKSLGWLP